MQNSGKTKLTELNDHLTCILCKGYFIDATTIVECLHSFCRTCIVSFLQTNKHCPTCEVQVHKTRPLKNIRSDQTLQDIVYKIVPNLYKNEMKRRRDFYRQEDALIQSSIPTSSEKRGDVWGCDRLIFTSEDIISVSIEYSPLFEDSQIETLTNSTEHTSRRYFKCPGALQVYHLKKLLSAKFGLSPPLQVAILYMHDVLKDEYTLVDLAYIYSWKRNEPLRLFYKVIQVPKEDDSDLSRRAVEEIPCPIVLDLPALPIAPVPPQRVPFPPIAAAPSSRHRPSPPSPQMAAEPNDFRVDNPNPAAVKRQRIPEATPRSILKQTSQFEKVDTPLMDGLRKQVTFIGDLADDSAQTTPTQYPGHRKLFKLEPINGSAIKFRKKAKTSKSS